MPLSTQPYKGARDFYPDAKRLQKYIFSKFRETVERYGYEEYDAPILEPLELYLSKTSEEIVSEQTYTFEDRGGRKVVIRPEMTPTISRMVAARRQELSYPLRWYSIPNLWRYERPQHGRLREHWQLNVDLFGIENISAEQEIISITNSIFKSFGAKPNMFTIKLNSRKLMHYILKDYLGFDDVQVSSMSRLIDHLQRLDRIDFIAQAEALCQQSQRAKGTVNKMLDILAIKRITDLPTEFQNNSSVHELNRLIDLLNEAKINNTEFDISLMRGFDYYTDIVFEVYDNHPDNNRAIMGGGRYDGLVGLFGVDPVPTIGFGLGDVTLTNFLEIHELLPKLTVETDLYAIIIGNFLPKAQKIIDELRNNGINVAVDLSGRKLDRQLATAAKKDIPYVLIIGERELSDEQFTLRNMHSGKEEKYSTARIVSIIKDYRQSKDAINKPAFD